MAGLEDLEDLEALPMEAVADGDKVSICGEIKKVELEKSDGSGKYPKWVIPVEKDGAQYALWVFANDARKVKRSCGVKLTDYIKAVITLGIAERADKKDASKVYKSLEIREVEKA